MVGRNDFLATTMEDAKFSSTSDMPANALHVDASTESKNDQYKDWYIDSAATDHICNQKSLFKRLQPVQNMKVSMGEGSSPILGIGEVTFKVKENGRVEQVTLLNVLYIPTFSKNLISVHCADAAGFHVHAYNGKMSVYRNSPKSCLMVGESYRKLYRVRNIIDEEYRPTCANQNRPTSAVNTSNHVPRPTVNAVSSSKTEDIDLWHSRFGHMHKQGIIYMSKDDNVHGLNLTNSQSKLKCDVCSIAKSTRASFHGLDHVRSVKPLQLLHMDLWGPSRIESSGGSRYLYTITDDFSRYSWVFPIKRKSDAFESFKTFQVKMDKIR
jgi:hypothetical protein